MSTSPNVIQTFFAQLTAPQTLAQIVVVILALVAALIASFFARRWWQRQATTLPASGLHTSVIEAGSLLAPILVGLLVVLVGRGLFASQDLDTHVLDVSMQLITALMLVRLAVYLLRLVLGPRSWLRGYESKLTLMVWLAISFQLIGWFNAIENVLDAINLLPGKAHFSIWDLLKGLVVVTAFILITSLVARAIEFRVMRIENLALSTRIGVSKFSYVLLVSLGVLLGIRAAGVDLTALTVLTGAIGLGLGFGLQSIASNFVSGFVLLMDRSIKPGDVISFTGTTGTSTENFGWVQELRGRYVVVRDRDGVETLVPNQSLITNPVINWSYSDRRVRLKLPVRISYRDDPEVALRVLVECATYNSRILQDPAPVSRLMHFGESGMDLELRFWISDPENGVNNVRSEVNRAIWRLFKENSLTIPVTQREVQVRGPGAFG
jgi:small-conductance mechanosensitive channel